MSLFIKRIHAAVREAQRTRHGTSTARHPHETGLAKEYPRMPRIALPPPLALDNSLSRTIRERRSFDTYVHRGFSIQELGTLLGVALGATEKTYRAYPSAGALFPIETYFVGDIFMPRSLDVYHYHAPSHSLEHLWEAPEDMTIANIVNQKTTPSSPALLIFTAVWDRSSVKYGDLSYAHGLIEAGHMAQNILLTATAMKMPVRPVAGFRDEAVTNLLDLGDDEQPVYAVALCGTEKI